MAPSQTESDNFIFYKLELGVIAANIESSENDLEYEFGLKSFSYSYSLLMLTSSNSFSESVVVAGTSHEMLEVLAFCNWERAQPPSITVTVLTFLVKKSTMKNFGGSIF